VPASLFFLYFLLWVRIFGSNSEKACGIGQQNKKSASAGEDLPGCGCTKSGENVWRETTNQEKCIRRRALGKGADAHYKSGLYQSLD